VLGDRLRLERNGEVGGFEHDQAELAPLVVVQQQGEVIEGMIGSSSSPSTRKSSSMVRCVASVFDVRSSAP
jgi:hypothetical protein